MAHELTREQQKRYWLQRIEGWTEAKVHKLHHPDYWPADHVGRAVALEVFRRCFRREPEVSECGPWIETWAADRGKAEPQTS